MHQLVKVLKINLIHTLKISFDIVYRNLLLIICFRKIYTLQGWREIRCHNKIEMVEPEFIEHHVLTILRGQPLDSQLQQVIVIDWIDRRASQLHVMGWHVKLVGDIAPKINKSNVLHRHDNQLRIAHFHARNSPRHIPAQKSSQLHYYQLVWKVSCRVLF